MITHIKFTRQELFDLITDFMPIRLGINTQDDNAEHWVELSDPSDLRIDAGLGISLAFKVQLHWPLPLLPDDFTIRRVEGLIVPQIVCADGEASLAMDVNILEIDTQYIPKVLDNLLTTQIQKIMSALEARLIWKITQAMGVSVEMPGWIEPRMVADITAKEARVDLHAEGLDIDVPLNIDIKKDSNIFASINFNKTNLMDEDVDLLDMAKAALFKP